MADSGKSRDELLRQIKNLKDTFASIESMASIGHWSWEIEPDRAEWSDQVYEIFKAPRKPPTYEFAKSFVHPEDLELWESTIRGAVENRKPFSLDYRAIRADGEEIWIHNESKTVFNDSGEFVGYIGTLQDISTHKKLERELRKNEEKYRLLSENIPVVVYSALPDEKSTTTFITGNVQELMGYSAAEVLEDPELWASMIHPDDRPHVFQQIAHHRKHKTTLHTEYRIVTKDGDTRWIRDKANPIFDDDGRIIKINGFIEDITETRLARESLIESRMLLKETQERARLGGWEWNIAEGKATWTDEMYSIYGVDKDFDTSDLDNLLSFFHEKDREAVLQAFRRCISEREPYQITVGFRNASGEDLWCRTMGEPVIHSDMVVGVRGFFQDITEIKTAHEELKKSDDRLRFLAENMADIIWTTDLSFRTTYVSPSIKTLLGFNPDERSDQAINEIITPDSLLKLRERFVEEMKREESETPDPDRFITMDVEYYKKDGTTIWLENRMKWIRDSHGTINGILGASRDITESKRLEESLRESERQKELILNSSVEMIAYYDTDLRVIWANKAAGDSVGKTTDELIGMHCYQVWNQRSSPCDGCPVVKALKEKKPHTAEQKTPDGRHWLLRGYPVMDDDENVIALVEFGQDITEQKTMESAIRESEAKFRTLVDQAPQALFLHDMDANIMDVNQATIDRYGYTREELLTMKAVDIDPDYREREEGGEFWNDLKKQGHLRFEARHQKKSGESFPVEIRLSTAKIANTQYVIALAEDITKRKQTEAAIRESESKFRGYIENAPDGVFIADERGNYIEVNNAATDITGYSRDELVGMKFSDLIPPHGRKIARAHFSTVQNQGKAAGDIPFLRKDGTLHYWTVTAVRLSEDRFMAFTKDITEKKRTEQALRESEERNRLLFEHAGLGIGYYTPGGELIAFNKAAVMYMDGDPGDFPGKSVTDIFGQDAGTEYAERIRTASETDESRSYEDEVPLPAGPRWFHSTYSRVTDGTGKVLGVQVISRDISERKRAEQKLEQYSRELEDIVEERTRSLRDAQNKLVRNEKLASLGEMAGSVAHELRNPLAVLSNAAYYLKMISKDDEKMKEYLDIMDYELSITTKIVSDLLDLARTQSPSKTAIQLNALFESLIRKLDIPPGIKIKNSIPSDFPALEADIHQLKRVFINILTNGIEALSHGGSISVTAEAMDSSVAITIQDTGSGMEPDVLSRIFEPLYTSKSHGIGLGLPICKNIVEAHNGTIEFESEAGKGTTVRVVLPTGEHRTSNAESGG